MNTRDLTQMRKLVSEMPEPDYFACGTTAFNMIKGQLGITKGCTEFTHNGFVFKLDKAMMAGQVAGIGPKCAAAAKAMSEMIAQGKA
ncbi:hypothetical protein SIPHO059v1_p0063 [Vibrio phage 264E42.1]|nr:hypothetical protein SIPHO059v1_p0063 [Vibrio phage 264E42.1]